MRIVIVILAVSFFGLKYSHAQETVQKDSLQKDSEELFYEVDKPAEFPGGFAKFYKFIAKNLRYPADARRMGVEGKVLVEFVIDSTGNVRQESVRIHTGLSESCDQEAIRLIKLSPPWKPAYVTKLEKHVPIRMVMPIVFKLG